VRSGPGAARTILLFIPLVLGPLNNLVWYVPSLRYTRSLGWRMHCSAEVTESSTNKQHHLSNAKLEFFPDKPGWTPTHWMTTRLPFEYVCLHNIATKYVDTGVTDNSDAITKHYAYVASKTFIPSNITKWVSNVEHAWAGWRNTVTDPEHMAAVELVCAILSSDNKDWKTWSFSFATQQGDKPYMVADLLVLFELFSNAPQQLVRNKRISHILLTILRHLWYRGV
jgi:hypothetical protein